MSIQTFIQQEVLLARLKRHGVLVVYDPARHYRDLCLNMASEALKVVDATDSSIESREEAICALGELGQPDAMIKGLLIYVPAPAPLTDEAKQRDPFALYAACVAYSRKEMGMSTGTCA
jgi:hypothetical protein